MKYVKCRFVKNDVPSGRAYAYRTGDDLKPGDFAMNDKGKKLVVVDEEIDLLWIEAYGADNLSVVNRYVKESEE